MSTNETPSHRPVNLAGVSWSDHGRMASFGASRPGFGVEVVATGELVSSDGVQPSCWSSKSIAAVHAEFPNPNASTVEVVR